MREHRRERERRRREAHVVALEAERADEDIGDVRVVLDDEHAR